MKLLAAMCLMVLVGCKSAPKPTLVALPTQSGYGQGHVTKTVFENTDEGIWEQRFAKLREDIYTENQYIKGHKGQLRPDTTELQVDVLNHSYPKNGPIDLHFRLLSLTLCRFTLADSIYWYGMGIGNDPTEKVENCYIYGSETRP